MAIVLGSRYNGGARFLVMKSPRRATPSAPKLRAYDSSKPATPALFSCRESMISISECDVDNDYAAKYVLPEINSSASIQQKESQKEEFGSKLTLLSAISSSSEIAGFVLLIYHDKSYDFLMYTSSDKSEYINAPCNESSKRLAFRSSWCQICRCCGPTPEAESGEDQTHLESHVPITYIDDKGRERRDIVHIKHE